MFAEGCHHVLCDNVAAFQLVTVWRGAPGGRRAWTPTASAWSRWARTAAVPCTGTSTARGCTRRTRCRGKPTESWPQTGNSPHASPPNVWVQGARRGTAQPARLEGTPLDCCCVGGRRRGACGGAGGAWERAGAVRGETGVAKQTASCPASRIVSEPACSLCGTGRACCGSDAACPTTFLPVCPAPCRQLPDQAPSQWESLLSSPPWPVAALI